MAFGDSATTSKAADILVKMHSKGIGTDPVTGIRYDANDPHSQLWIHLTAWHSILYAYVDSLVVPVMKIAFWLANIDKRAKLEMLTFLSPMTRDVVAPVLFGVVPENPETLTPSEARARYGYDKPADAHRELRDRQAAKVFGEGTEPSEGILSA